MMKRFQAQDGHNKRKRESSNERTPGFKKQGKRNAPKQPIKKSKIEHETEYELLPAEEQAAFFLRQYHAIDPTTQLSKGQTMPKGENFKVSSFVSETKRSTEELAEWLKDIVGPSWQNVLCAKPKDEDVKGAPSVIIVTSAGTRACDLYRGLAEFNKEVRIGKLFAKHIKLQEQVQQLNSTVYRIVIGTPHRLAELCEKGALKLGNCQHLVLDMWKNVKGCSLLVRGAQVQTDFYKFYYGHLNGKAVTTNSEKDQKQQMFISLF